MNKTLDFEKIASLVQKIDKVKSAANKLELFNKDIQEQTGERISDLISHLGEKEALGKIMGTSATGLQNLTEADLSLTMPLSTKYLGSVLSLEEFEAALDRYLADCPPLAQKLHDFELEQLGCHKFYNELPLYEAKDFADALGKLVNPPDGEFIVFPYDLNDELGILLNSNEEADELCKLLAPATAYYLYKTVTPHVLKEISCW